jgi:hypothetical protein
MCTVDHNAAKKDLALWKTFRLDGYQYLPADETGPAETLEYRTCLRCGGTFAIVIDTASANA